MRRLRALVLLLLPVLPAGCKSGPFDLWGSVADSAAHVVHRNNPEAAWEFQQRRAGMRAMTYDGRELP